MPITNTYPVLDFNSDYTDHNVNVFADLAKMLMEKSRKVPIAIVGSGVSAQSQLPDWGKMMSHLHDSIQNANDVRNADKTFLDALKDSKDLQWRAEEYVRVTSKQFLHDRLAEQFGKVQPSSTHKLVMSLGFKAVLTTNYDHLLEDACDDQRVVPIDWSSEDQRQKFLRNLDNTEIKHVVYLHGRLGNPDSLVISESDYVDRYIKTEQINRQLFALIMNHPMVFIGYSLNDPELTNILRVANAHRGGSPPHIAILSWEARNQTTSALRNARVYNGKYGIRPLYYSKVGSDYANLPRLLEALEAARGTEPEHLEQAIQRYIDHRLSAVFTAAFEKSDHGEKAKAEALVEKYLETTVETRNEDLVSETWTDDVRQMKLMELTAQALLDANAFSFPRISQSGDFSLNAEVEETEYLGWYRFRVLLSGPKTFNGTATLSLDPRTFRAHQKEIRVKNGLAIYENWAYGAFTIGATIMKTDGSELHLSIDLAKLNTAPVSFRAL